MIHHILKMLWNEKRRFYGIITEQIFVFIILMIAIISVTTTIHQYLSPGMLDTDDVVSCYYTTPQNVDVQTARVIINVTNSIIDKMRNKTYVKAITRGLLMAPYLRSVDDPNSNPSDSVQINNQKFIGYLILSDEYGYNVFRPKLIDGKWFDGQQRLENGNQPMIVTQQFSKNANLINPVGKVVYYHNTPYQIIGVIDGLKHAALTASTPKIILYHPSNNLQNYTEICVRLKPDHKEIFMSDYCKEFNRVFGGEVQPYLFDLSLTKQINMFPTTSKITLQIIPTLFLFIFTFLGTLGLFWIYSKRRIQEFGLRLAIGSTNRGLIRLVITESIFITAIAILPGIILALFLYPMNKLHIISIVTTIIIMLCFSMISAWYPAHRVTKIDPAEVLHNE